MGLDIALMARIDNEESDFKCRGLSPTFCQMVCDLTDLEGKSPELRQLFKLLELDITPVLKMNVWDVDQHILYDMWSLTYEEIELRYEKAWQDAVEMHTLFNGLYNKIDADPGVFEQLQPNYDWAESKKYYEGTATSEGQSFSEDLKTIIAYLEKVKQTPNAEVRFHFS